MTVAEELEIAVRLNGGEQAAASLEKFEQAIKQAKVAAGSATSATQATSKGLLGVTDASKKSALGMASNVNLVSELALGFGSLSPATRGLSMAFAGAGNNAFALAGALGPIGVIGGTLVALIPGLIGLFGDTEESLDGVTGAAEQAAIILSSLEQSAIDAANGIEDAIKQVQRLTEAQDLLNRLQAGEGTRDEQEAFFREAQGAREAAQRRLRAWIDDLGLSSTETSLILQKVQRGSADFNQSLLSDLDSQQQAQLRGWASTFAFLDQEIRKRQELVSSGTINDAAARQLEAQEEAEKAARRGRGRRRSSRSREPSLDDLMSRARTSPTDRMIGGLAEDADFSDTGEVIVESMLPATKAIDEAQEALFRLQDRMNNAAEEIPGLTEELTASWRGGIESVHDAYEALINKQIEAGQVTTEQSEIMALSAKAVANTMVESIGGDMRSAFSSSMDAILDGTKTGAEAFEEFAKSIIKSLVKRSIVEVVVNAAEAIAAAARYDYAAAAQHAVAAGMWAAVGGVAAGVGFGTGLLGGGGKPSADPNAGVSALPEDTNQERGGGTTVINVGTFPVSTEGEIGRAVRNALDAADREGL